MRASARMRPEWEPRLRAVELRESKIKAEREALERASKIRHGMWSFCHAMSVKQKAALGQAIDVKARAVARNREDAREQVEGERRRVMNAITQRMKPILEEYARDHGYSLVLESSAQESPVLAALNDITTEIVSLRDRAHPAEQ